MLAGRVRHVGRDPEHRTEGDHPDRRDPVGQPGEQRHQGELGERLDRDHRPPEGVGDAELVGHVERQVRELDRVTVHHQHAAADEHEQRHPGLAGRPRRHLAGRGRRRRVERQRPGRRHVAGHPLEPERQDLGDGQHRGGQQQRPEAVHGTEPAADHRSEDPAGGERHPDRRDHPVRRRTGRAAELVADRGEQQPHRAARDAERQRADHERHPDGGRQSHGQPAEPHPPGRRSGTAAAGRAGDPTASPASSRRAGAARFTR